MSKNRLEAFTDAVIAIIMTILVLELRSPGGAGFADLWGLSHTFLVYITSFATLAIYWINHHHMFHATTVVSGKILWLNMLLLLCVSLFPFTTAWVENHIGARAPEITYGMLMLAADILWVLLNRALLREHDDDEDLTRALNDSKKSAFTIGMIVTGMMIGWFFWPPAVILSCLLSLISWVLPDRRIKQYMWDHKD